MAACRAWAYPLAHDRGWPLLRQGDFAFQPASLSWTGDPCATLLQWYHVADPAPPSAAGKGKSAGQWEQPERLEPGKLGYFGIENDVSFCVASNVD